MLTIWDETKKKEVTKTEWRKSNIFAGGISDGKKN